MIRRAEARGEIKPGDYPDRGHQRQHRHRAGHGGGDPGLPHGADHAGAPERGAARGHEGLRRRNHPGQQGGGMEGARDLAEEMEARRQGHRCSTSSPTRTIRAPTTRAPAPRSGATRRAGSPISSAPWAPPAPSWATRAICKEEPGNPDRRRAAGGGRHHSRHPQLAAGLPAEDLRRGTGRSDYRGRPGGRRRTTRRWRHRRASSPASPPAARWRRP